MDKIFYEIFEALPRQGPGDEKSTRKAFKKLGELPEHPEILDVGCGTGAQTMALAKLTPGKITALDNHIPFIEKLKHAAHQANCPERILCIVGDMASMPFDKDSFDLIWSEGAANIMGFKKALDTWRPLLRQRGYMVVSEMVWFEKEAPQEIRGYFTEQYPDMKHYEQISLTIESAGYRMIDYFPLPKTVWWTGYYKPIEKTLAEIRQKYQNNKDAQAIFDSLQQEIDMYRKYSKYYGYGFYIMQKRQDLIS
ncbi:MAG: methyltransferase domain-containing protein [Chloroflexota bacterium]